MRVSPWCVLAVAACLAVPAGAGAATYKIDAGYDGLPGAPEPTAPLKYYVPSITVHQGAKVTWTMKGFHTVTFLKRKQKVPAFIQPDSHQITNFNDAAGNPFWFNGRPYGGFTPDALTKTKVKAYTGSEYVNTGFPTEGSKLTLSFPKKGKFTYYCLVHPGMAGAVRVVGRNRKVKTPAQVAAQAARLKAADATAAHKTDTIRAPADTVYVGYQVGDVAVNRMFPQTLTVDAGTQVTFSGEKQNIGEVHTATWGPEGPQAQKSVGGMQLPGGPAGYFVLSPYAGPYPSEADASSISYDGANHGDGFLSLGLLAKTLPAVKVRFTKAGSYDYICIFHPGMEGTINVRSSQS